jgi:phage terminase large subunit-like protein
VARRTTTRSAEVELPDQDTLDELKLSPEVAYYLVSRGIPLPDCPPLIKTPEAGEVLPDARFDPERVDRVLAAFARVRHTQGGLAGKPLNPDPWQIAYLICPVFGWVHQNDAGDWVRVVRELYADIPRKNGKSTTCGGIGLYLTGADDEPGAQVLAAATTTEQAGYVFEPVKQLAGSSTALKKHFKSLAKKVVHRKSGSYFKVVSSVAEALHGANVHGAVIDELHIHESPDLVEAIETGVGSRRQPLIVIITTADTGKQGTIYARKRKRVENLANRTLTFPGTYGVVWAAEEKDDPFAEATWKKANPGYGISPTREFLMGQAQKAKDDPVELASFLRLHLGIRTKQTTKYIPMDIWDRNASMVLEHRLKDRECYGGLDLASTSDICALAWDFPDDDGGHDVIWRLWMPERAFGDLEKRTAGEARVWRDRGFLTVTPGEVADYAYIRKTINKDRETFDVRDIAYDRWNSSQLVVDLMGDDVEMVQMGQGFVSMSPPLKQLKHLLLEGTEEKPKYRHGGNPVLRWMVDNLAVAKDAAGNVKPDKEKSGDKIDGISAAVNAIDRAINRPKKLRSAYEDDDLMVV